MVRTRTDSEKSVLLHFVLLSSTFTNLSELSYHGFESKVFTVIDFLISYENLVIVNGANKRVKTESSVT